MHNSALSKVEDAHQVALAPRGHQQQRWQHGRNGRRSGWLSQVGRGWFVMGNLPPLCPRWSLKE